MKNMKIKKKLVYSFLTVAFFAVILGVVSIITLMKVDSIYNQVTVIETPALYHLGQAESNLRGERSELRAMLAYVERDDPQKLLGRTEALEANRAAFRFHMQSFKELQKHSPEAMADYAKLEAAYNEYSTGVDEFIRISGTMDADATFNYLSTFAANANEVLAELTIMSGNQMEGVTQLSDSATAAAASGGITVIITLAVVVILSVLLGLYIARIITKPILIIQTVAKQVGETGDLAFSDDFMKEALVYAQYKDEAGQTLNAFSKLMDSILAKSIVLKEISSGNLRVNINKLSDRDALGNAVSDLVENLNNMFSSINIASNQVSLGSQHIADGAQALASGSTQQAAAVEELNASISEVAEEAEENMRNIKTAMEYVKQAGVGAASSNQQMGLLTESMTDIGSASRQIAGITKAIEDIAFQTNILALNAAVEAARAGQHGKGFAVVADEVRNLAGKSAVAAKQTAELIETAVRTVERGTEITAQTAELLQSVEISAQSVTESIERVAHASAGQTSAIELIKEGLNQVSSVVQTNAATAEENSATSEEMAAQAATLQQEVQRFTLRDEKSVTPYSAKQALISYTEDSTASPSSSMPLGKY